MLRSIKCAASGSGEKRKMITREKTTRSGRLLEVDYYMVDRAGRRIPKHIPKPKSKAELAAQEEYEKKRRIKKAVRPPSLFTG